MFPLIQWLSDLAMFVVVAFTSHHNKDSAPGVSIQTTTDIACVAGGIGSAGEIKFRLSAPAPKLYFACAYNPANYGFQSPSPHSPRGFAVRLSAPPLKLYFACAYNPASYAG